MVAGAAKKAPGLGIIAIGKKETSPIALNMIKSGLEPSLSTTSLVISPITIEPRLATIE